jgi:hypothetical protein
MVDLPRPHLESEARGGRLMVERRSINWRGGLIRIWLALTVCWFVLCFVMVFIQRDECVPAERVDGHCTGSLQPVFYILLVGVPLAVLVLGTIIYLAATWIGRGFQRAP